MLKPICVPCQRFYRPKKNGYYFVEGMPIVNGAKPGTDEPGCWVPYKLWVGDLWECEGCGSTIIVGTGRSPVLEHYQSDFKETIVATSADRLQVNDC